MLYLIISCTLPLHWIKISLINKTKILFTRSFFFSLIDPPVQFYTSWVHVNTTIVYFCVKEKKKTPRFARIFWNFMHQLPSINSRRNHGHSNNSWEEVLSPDFIRHPIPSHISLVKLRSSGRFPL